MSSSTTSSKSKPKLSPVILEAMVRNLSDHDLLRFMLSSKEAFNATLDALSTVDYVSCHDENFENEPCIAFKMRGDLKDRIQLNYVTQSNPLYNFLVNYLQGRIITFQTCNLVKVECWVLNVLITSRLQKLSLGTVLPVSCIGILQHASNLTNISFSTFDILVANNFIPSQCKKIVVDFFELYEMKDIVALLFKPALNVEEIHLGEPKVFATDYDEYFDDYMGLPWKKLINFLKSFFPSLKTLNIHVGGTSNCAIKILHRFNDIKNFLVPLIPSNIKACVSYNILIPPNEWLAFRSAFIDLAFQANNLKPSFTPSFEVQLKKGIKDRCFPDDGFQEVPLHYNCSIIETMFTFELKYYNMWNKYDFDAENNQEYHLEFDEWDDMISPEHAFQPLIMDDSSVETLDTISTFTSPLSFTDSEDVVTDRDEFWSRESQALCSENASTSDISYSIQAIMVEDSHQSDINTTVTLTCEESVTDPDESKTSLTSEDSTIKGHESQTCLISENSTTNTDESEASLTSEIKSFNILKIKYQLPKGPTVAGNNSSEIISSDVNTLQTLSTQRMSITDRDEFWNRESQTLNNTSDSNETSSTMTSEYSVNLSDDSTQNSFTDNKTEDTYSFDIALKTGESDTSLSEK